MQPALDYEKLGAFYLGKSCDPSSGALDAAPLLYDSKDLTTHAVCVGMTGSGKTGLGIALLEEAAIDGIPALIIDPKGDMGNLVLTFPQLRTEDFLPWIDPADAARKGVDKESYAAQTAIRWREGLREWEQPPERIQRLREAAEVTIYTPGSDAGRPISLLRSFDPPDSSELADATAMRERLNAAVSGLLGLLGITADPLRSREHILLTSLLDHAWREGRAVSLAELINAIQKPPFDRVGVFDLETFYPAKDRLGLAMTLNNLLAAPGFDIWMRGEPLDIQRLLYTRQGRPRLAVLSLAHLSDGERMFFVTLLLNAVISWMRRQSGTASLRALLYMDEIFGYFPSNGMPPSKTPMLTLLKQARAYGLGIMLSTQNPVDLDYKGLANAGTWFIGRLQTERDKMRVLDGLEGVMAGEGATFDRAAMDKLIASLSSRTFLMRNAHEDQPQLFKSRWALSYLSGPMTPAQIRSVTTPLAAALEVAAPTAFVSAPSATPQSATAAVPAAGDSATPPAAPVVQHLALPATIQEFTLPPNQYGQGEVLWLPRLLGGVKLHFVSAPAKVDYWESRLLLAAIPEDSLSEPWLEASEAVANLNALQQGAPQNGQRATLPASAALARNFQDWKKQLAAHAYQNISLDLLSCPRLKRIARAGEREEEFKAAVALEMREKRDLEVEKIRKRYAAKLTTAQDRLTRAEMQSERKKGQLGQQKMQTAISFGAAILGAFMGKSAVNVGTVGRTATAMRGAGRVARDKQGVSQAAESVETCQERLQALEEEIAAAIARARDEYDSNELEFSHTLLRPRKTDISVNELMLLWTPWRRTPDGMMTPLFDWPPA